MRDDVTRLDARSSFSLLLHYFISPDIEVKGSPTEASSCSTDPELEHGSKFIMAVPVNALHANFDVDYVIVYRFTDTSMLLLHFCRASAHSHIQAKMRQTNILLGSSKL